jgi:glycopeptidolipid biosynthesis protein
MINMYGITETMVHASFREIVDGDVDSTASPIGVPLAHLGFFVLDGWLRSVWSVSCMWLVAVWGLAMCAGPG